MNFRIFILLLALLLLTANTINQAEDEQTQDEQEQDEDDITAMTFLVQHQSESDNDYIQINLVIQTSDSSLTNALAQATALVSTVSSIGQTYCQVNPEDDVECDQVVDAGDFQIQAKYQTVRKQQTFQEFIVSHQVTISVFHTQKIGQLADQLLKAGVTKLQSFDWASSQEDDAQEGAIEAGKQKSHDMCFHLGMKLHRIVAIQQVQEQGGQQAGGDQQQQQEQAQQEQQGPLVYRFEIECILDEETAARKAQQQEQQQGQQQQDEDEGDDEEQQQEQEQEQQEQQQQEEQEEQEQQEKPKKKSKKR